MSTLHRFVGTLLPSLGFALACGGVAPPESDEGAGSLEFATQPDPEPVDGPRATEGLGAELGFPVGSGEVKVSDAKNVEVLHISAFDPGYAWEDYKGRLEEGGWTWTETPVPPFKGIFDKDGKKILLDLELKGTSVWVRASTL